MRSWFALGVELPVEEEIKGVRLPIEKEAEGVKLSVEEEVESWLSLCFPFLIFSCAFHLIFCPYLAS